jgi:hypothetical protein
MAADDRYVYLTTDSGVLEVYELRPPKLTLPAGSVGIGTADPQARLEVQGGGTLLEQEAWQKLETWRPDGDDYVAYFKDSLGIVHLRGTLKSTVAAGRVNIGVLFSLPAGYRPEPGSGELHLVPARGLDGAGTWACVMLYPDGPVELQTGERAALILDGITFRAAR